MESGDRKVNHGIIGWKFPLRGDGAFDLGLDFLNLLSGFGVHRGS